MKPHPDFDDDFYSFEIEGATEQDKPPERDEIAVLPVVWLDYDFDFDSGISRPPARAKARPAPAK